MRHLGFAVVVLVASQPLLAQGTTDSSKTASRADSARIAAAKPDTPKIDTAKSNRLQRIADSTYNARLDRFKKLYRTTFIASGAVQTAVGSSASATPVSGSLGISHDTPKEHFSALIAVAANGDTLASANQRDYAIAVLSPGLTGVGKGSGVSLDYTRFFGSDICYPPLFVPAESDSLSDSKNKYNTTRQNSSIDLTHFNECQALLEAKRKNGLALDDRLGARIYASVSKSTWQLPGSTPVAKFADDLALVAFGIHIVWIPLNHPLDDKDNGFVFKMEGGFAARGIVGDIADSTEDALRLSLVGTKGTWFTGAEIEPSLQVNRVTAFSIISWLHNSHHGDHLSGLTGTQVVLGFSFDASVFNF